MQAVLARSLYALALIVCHPSLAPPPHTVLPQVATGGPGRLWKIFSATRKTTSAHGVSAVCVWVLDKKALVKEDSTCALRSGWGFAAGERSCEHDWTYSDEQSCES